MGSSKLERRSFLRGVGGAMLALPALEIMMPRRAAAAAPPPKRFVLMYGGLSLIADGNPTAVVPDATGPGYDLKRAMLPLGAGPLPSNPGLGGQGLDVQDHVSIVSGLKIPWDTGSGIPAGGRSPEFHYNSIGPTTSGMRSSPGRQEPPNGPTADQIVADTIAGDTPFRSLSYRVQAASYVGSNSTGGSDGRISYRDDGNGGLQAIDPVFSPQLAYSTLFGNFVPPDPAAAVAAARRLERHKSVVDLVHERARALRDRLGAADRIRLERHLDEVHALATRLDAVPPTGQGDCMLPPAPGDDPPVGGAAIEYQGEGGDGAGYSNEELRAELLGDMLGMAFACDLSRVAAIRMTYTQCHMQMGSLIGVEGDAHSAIGHNGRVEAYADCLGWHIKHFARLVARLRDTTDVDGSSLLDNTAVVLLFEGGYGYDPESGNDGLSAHSTENMVALVGGHAGGLNAAGGQHIVKTDWHPANAVLSAMNAVGVAADSETLGEVVGRIPELF
jgi:Protein of unknown function (DUF1552)